MIVLDQLPSILQWASQRLQCDFGPAYTIANYRDGKIVCVVVFNAFRQTSCEVSIVSERGITNRFFEVVFGYAFDLAKLNRLTAMAEVSNEKSIRLLERSGFKREGMLRRAADNGSDLYVYGLLREDCKWVKNPAVEMSVCHPHQSISR